MLAQTRPVTPVPERIETADVLLRAAHRKAYHLDEKELIVYLKQVLGRPLIAHITKTADVNNVSRWASGRTRPERPTWDRLRTLAVLHMALTATLDSETSAAQWFTGANPSLDFHVPADELREGNTTAVFAAVRDLAER